MSDVLKWLQNMANDEWEYEDGDYALEAIKFFNSLRADLAAERDRNGIITQAAQEVTNALRAENERLRESLKETLAIARRNEAGDYVDRALAAIEGVTEPASPWRDIESAPRDGTSIEVWDESPGAVNPAVVYWEEGVWVYADNLLADAAPDGALPSHWRQRSEPPR